MYPFLFFHRLISEDSLRRYVNYASESCIQELLSASVSSRVGGDDGWKVLATEDNVEISKRCSGSLHVFRSRWLLRSVSLEQFMTVANAIDAAKVRFYCLIKHQSKYIITSNVFHLPRAAMGRGSCGSQIYQSSRRQLEHHSSPVRLCIKAIVQEPGVRCV